MEKAKLPRLVKETRWPKKTEIWQRPKVLPKNLKGEKDIAAVDKSEENSAQNIKIENESKEETEKSTNKQSSTYLKAITLK